MRVRLQLWDTAGQERFRTLTTSYYRGTHCCVLVFDITSQESFYHLYQWIDQYNYYCEFPVKNIIIVGNKHDLAADRKVSELEIRQFADSMGCVYVPCSVLANQGIDTLVDTIIEKSIELEEQISNSGKDKGSIVSLGTHPNSSHDVTNIKPMSLNVKRKEKSCCSD